MGLRTDPDRLFFERGPVPREAASLGDFAEDLVSVGPELEVSPCRAVPGLQALGHIHPQVVRLGQVGEVLQAVGLEDADYPISAATEDELLADTEAGWNVIHCG